MVSRFVSVGDIKLFVVSEGSGDPVMLVHGGPGIGHYYLKSMIEHLADRFTVYSYDQRASGRSEVGDVGKITLGDSVADLDNLGETRGLEVVCSSGIHSGQSSPSLCGEIPRAGRL